MTNAITELFLRTYFLFDAVAGKFPSDTKVLFDKLYSAFLLPEEKRSELFSATQAETVREIETYGDYAQMCRIQKYYELNQSEAISAELADMIAIKGDALKKVKQIGFDEYAEGTEASICKLLNDTANMGVIPSLCVLGFMQCEGVFVPRNTGLGIKNLKKAAQWNSIEGALLALEYDECDRQSNLNRLYTVTHDTLYEGISDTARQAYSLDEPKTVPENKLLKKAFGAGLLKPEVYETQQARLIFSDALSLKDKERTLFSGHKEAVSETAELPLKLASGEFTPDFRAIEDLPIARMNEQRRIARMVNNTDMRGDSAYRPLCIASDSEYLIGLYVKAVSEAFRTAHVEKIDVADLGDYDFEPTKNNIFVRACDEDMQNLYILALKGEIREGVLNAVKNFLQSDKRRKFRLQYPSAVIDLSGILPICFCDKRNARLLKAHCDIVTLAPISEAEKSGLLLFMLREKASKYKIANLNIDQSARDMLVGYTVDRAESLIERVIRYNRDGDSLDITAEMLKEDGGEIGMKNIYGFGGAENESN